MIDALNSTDQSTFNVSGSMTSTIIFLTIAFVGVVGMTLHGHYIRIRYSQSLPDAYIIDSEGNYVREGDIPLRPLEPMTFARPNNSDTSLNTSEINQNNPNNNEEERNQNSMDISEVRRISTSSNNNTEITHNQLSTSSDNPYTNPNNLNTESATESETDTDKMIEFLEFFSQFF